MRSHQPTRQSEPTRVWWRRWPLLGCCLIVSAQTWTADSQTSQDGQSLVPSTPALVSLVPELFRSSMVVIVVIFLLTAVLFGYDLVLKYVITRVLGLGGGD